MSNVIIELPPALSQRLCEEAARLGVEPEELGLAAILNLFEQPTPDFKEVAARVLRRNDHLYRRLA